MDATSPAVTRWYPVPVRSEERLDVEGTGFGPAPKVRAVELSGIYDYPNTLADGGPTHVAVAMPTVRALETHPAYVRNALGLDVALVVVAQDAPLVESPEFSVKTLLPPPTADVAVRVGAELYFGRIDGRVDLPPVGTTVWVGGPERGEVRLYTDDVSPDVDAARAEIADLADLGATVLSDATALALSQLRERGTKLAVESWHESGVLVSCPDTTPAGVAVLWRDDLPSEPQPVIVATRLALDFEIVPNFAR